MYIYRLTHSHLVEGESDVYDTKSIGYFYTYEEAKSVAEQYKPIIGFRDYPKDFCIDKIKLDRCKYKHFWFYAAAPNFKELEKVYPLYYEYENKEEDYSVVECIGVFSNLERAQTVLNKIREYKQYKKPDGEVTLVRYTIGETEWKEGFVSSITMDRLMKIHDRKKECLF